MCDAFRYRMHDEWHRVASEYTAQPSQDNLDRVLKLAGHDLEAMNRKITAIQNGAAELGVTDLALIPDSLSSEDMFGVPLGHKRIGLASGRNGRPAEGKSSLNVYEDARASSSGPARPQPHQTRSPRRSAPRRADITSRGEVKSTT
jgi:hypothetical protein